MAEMEIDKKIPIALLFTMFLQTGAAIWWASGISSKVDVLEKSDIRQEIICDKVIRMEVQLEYIRESLDEIKEHLENHLEDK